MNLIEHSSRYARYVHEVFVALPMSSSEKVSLEHIQTLLKVQDPRLGLTSLSAGAEKEVRIPL